jgi:hypothetical protein
MLKEMGQACLGATVVFVLGCAVTAEAQTPRVEVSAGYQAPYDRSIEQWFAVGWSVDVAANLRDSWGIVGEVAGAHRTDDGLDVNLGLHTFGGGMRFSRRTMSRVLPFAQLVLGWARMSSRANIAGGEIENSQTKLMLQPGGGLSILVGQRWGFVGQVDYRRIFLDEDEDGRPAVNEMRLLTGIRFTF